VRFGLLVDASCDLPAQVLAQPNVVVLPIHVRVNNDSWVDDRSSEVRQAFLGATDAIGWRGTIETVPLNVDETREFVLKNLVTQFDYVFAITLSRTRSVIYDTLTEVAIRIQPLATKARTEANIKGPFRLQVCDSSTLFSGHGVIALSLLDELTRNTVTPQISRLIETVYAQNAYTYFAPAGLTQLYQKAKQRGDRSLNFVSYALGSALDIKPIVCAVKGNTAPVAKVRHFEDAANKVFENAAIQVKNGLLSPHLVVSNGGGLDAVRTTRGFEALTNLCARRGVTLHEVPMGIGALVNAGVGGVAVGFLANEHTFE
jgi:fatty acid-binding protein DegV